MEPPSVSHVFIQMKLEGIYSAYHMCDLKYEVYLRLILSVITIFKALILHNFIESREKDRYLKYILVAQSTNFFKAIWGLFFSLTVVYFNNSLFHYYPKIINVYFGFLKIKCLQLPMIHSNGQTNNFHYE